MKKTVLLVLISVLVTVVGCGVSTERFTELDAVLNSDLSWPRQLQSEAGRIEVQGPPQRILTLSVGHDEMVYALLGGDTTRMAGVSSATPDYSNIGDKVEHLPALPKTLEAVLQVRPDILILDKFTSAEHVAAFRNAGLKVFQTSLEDKEFNIPNILTLGYLLGLEREAQQLVDGVNARLQKIESLTSGKESPRVVAMSGGDYGVWVNGGGSSADAIIKEAGGVNAAHEVSSLNGFVELESLLVFAPDVIFLIDSSAQFKEKLRSSPILSSVAAVKNNRIHDVTSLYFTTLSPINRTSPSKGL